MAQGPRVHVGCSSFCITNSRTTTLAAVELVQIARGQCRSSMQSHQDSAGPRLFRETSTFPFHPTVPLVHPLEWLRFTISRRTDRAQSERMAMRPQHQATNHNAKASDPRAKNSQHQVSWPSPDDDFSFSDMAHLRTKTDPRYHHSRTGIARQSPQSESTIMDRTVPAGTALLLGFVYRNMGKRFIATIAAIMHPVIIASPTAKTLHLSI